MGARRRFGGVAALDGIDLRLRGGEIYALLGRNGAGKSTLAKAALGILALDQGSVRVLGADPHRDRRVRRAIGVAPQEIALYPRLTVAENLTVFAALAGMERAGRAQAVQRALELASCTARAGERVERLSGGWKRRANLAAALVHDPRFLVLDEPGEGLDAETREALSAALRALRDKGAAILLISHDALGVAQLADRAGVIHRGRMAAEGEPRGLIEEAFGTKEELIVRLRTAPSLQTSALLSQAGLAPATDGLAWSGLVADAAGQARSLHDGLAGLGADFAELSVRPAGLDLLIRHVSEAAAW